MGRFVPRREQNEFFGFLAFSGKLTAFSRAYRDWTGMSPRVYRMWEHASGAGSSGRRCGRTIHSLAGAAH
jgi:hypothetical protein